MTLDINGPWHVTTEGDDEGRTTRDLGNWRGPFDRVALGLADKAYYTLTIEPVVIGDANDLPILRKTVHVHDYNGKIDIPRLMQGRPVLVRGSNFYQAFEIAAGPAYFDEYTSSIAQQAMKKLTPEELTALRKEIERQNGK